MVLLPGAALVATEAFAQSHPTATSTHKALKRASKYGREKYAYKVPKTAAKQAKYIGFLTSFLSLSTTQQEQANTIFSTAIASREALRTQVQAAHEALSGAVKANNMGAITQASAEIATLGAQRHTLGAQANASFYQILTPAQQTTLAKFQTKNTTARTV